MSGTVILEINIVLYALAFVFYFARYGWRNLSTILLGTYLMGSVFSFVYYINPLFFLVFTSKGDISLGGVVYLFCVNFLLCTALRNFKLPVGEFQLTGYPRKFINFIQYFLFFVFLASILASFSGITEVISNDDLADLRNVASETGQLGSKFFLLDLVIRAFGACDVVLLVISVVSLLLLNDNRKINYLSLFLFLLNSLKVMYLYVSRATVILTAFELLGVFLIFARRIPVALKRKLYPVLLGVTLVCIPFFLDVTNARFSNNSESVYNDLSFIRYAGEAQLNFIGIMYGNTTGEAMGYRMMPLYRRALGLPYAGEGKNLDHSVTADYMNRFNPKGPNYVFYQLVGSHYIEWGGLPTFLFALLLNVYANRHFRRAERTGRYSFMTLLFVCFLFYYIGYGVFYALYGNESGNFLFLFMVVFSIIFKHYGGVCLIKERS